MASEASRKAPEEVFAGGGGAGGTRGSAAGAVKADGELTKEDRKASRARQAGRQGCRAGEGEDQDEKARAAEEKEKAAEEAGFARKVPKVSMLAAAPAGGGPSRISPSPQRCSQCCRRRRTRTRRGWGEEVQEQRRQNKSALKL